MSKVSFNLHHGSDSASTPSLSSSHCFTYGKDSSVVVAYSDSLSVLAASCLSPTVPEHNHDPCRPDRKASSVQDFKKALWTTGRQEGSPLLVIVKAPISVMVKSLALRQFMVNVNCSLVVDNLHPTRGSDSVKHFTPMLRRYYASKYKLPLAHRVWMKKGKQSWLIAFNAITSSLRDEFKDVLQAISCRFLIIKQALLALCRILLGFIPTLCSSTVIL
uniref:Uncharacterized protein n=1 Tax=Salix viminalis TaxID=40686 RepID=A0A6N2L8W6_SALVM